MNNQQQLDYLQLAERMAGLGHWQLNLKQETLYWSDEIYAIHGVTPQTYSPKLNSAVDFYHPDDKTRVNDYVKNAIEVGEDFQFDLRIVRPSGEVRQVKSRAQCIKDDKGTVISVFGIFQDITKIKKTEDALRKANDELEEFTYRTSHDLRSPLISASKLLGIIEEKLGDGDVKKALEYLSPVRTSLDNLESLVTDILRLTRLNHSESELSLVDIKGFIDSLINKFDYIESFQQVEFSIIAEFEHEIAISKAHMTVILENLISNAIKYYDPEKQENYVDINISKIDDCLRIRMRDNGIGFPKTAREKKFKMFNRFHPRVSTGSGLGLYMAQKSAFKLGGKIEYQPLDEGSEFNVVLPLVKKKQGDNA